MKIAVLSGKGGAGKTFTAVNLAAAAEKAVYIDCDVEEPNGRLFFQPQGIQKEEVTTKLPEFDPTKCNGCKACVEFCKFHALIYIKEKPKVFQEVCHACGGCSLVCPNQAVSEKERPVGMLETGCHGEVRVITGILNLGEASAVPVIKKALQKGDSEEKDIIIDCPPGSACSVMESIEDADYCLLVAEPTAFGFHNFCMVHELAGVLGKPCGVVINKYEEVYEPLEDYCREYELPVLLRIPYEEEIASAVSKGKILSEQSPEYKERFQALLSRIGGENL
nr:ATP-binding protein [uncultured Blautia sp.]